MKILNTKSYHFQSILACGVEIAKNGPMGFFKVCYFGIKCLIFHGNKHAKLLQVLRSFSSTREHNGLVG